MCSCGWGHVCALHTVHRHWSHHPRDLIRIQSHPKGPTCKHQHLRDLGLTREFGGTQTFSPYNKTHKCAHYKSKDVFVPHLTIGCNEILPCVRVICAVTGVTGHSEWLECSPRACLHECIAREFIPPSATQPLYCLWVGKWLLFFFFLISRLLMLSPFVICGTPTDLNRILAFGQIYWKQETQNRSPRISWGLVMEHSGSCGCPDGINMLINTWSVRATFYSCFNRALQILPHLTVHSLYFPKLYFFILNLLRYLYFWFKNRKTWSSLMRAVRGMGTTLYFHILFACM